MREAVICMPLRTAVGRYGGVFRDVEPNELAAAVIQEVMSRTGLAGDQVDDVILGQGYPSSEAPGLGRVAALDAGLPVTVPGMQVDRRCGSGLQAVIDGVMRVQTGAADIVLAGGAESMSGAEYYSTTMRWGARAGEQVMHDRLGRGRVTAGGRNWPVPGGMIETAENLRKQYGISRKEQDELAVLSHQRATAAQSNGLFDDEIVPFTVRGRRGETIVAVDEHPRADTSMESLARLKPVMIKQDPDATVTAGNASGQNDGASICVVTTRETADELGLSPFARLVSWAVAGVTPATMGIGPVPAAKSALSRANISMADLALIELNEAFAAQVLAVLREWELPVTDPRFNVHGSGIALGHPIGATGGRILATMLHELRRRGSGLALETMCIGGGQGLAAVFEGIAD